MLRLLSSIPFRRTPSSLSSTRFFMSAPSESAPIGASSSEGSNEASSSSAPSRSEWTASEERLHKTQKKKVALLLGYTGSSFCGSAWQKNAVTMEGELVQSLFKAGMILPTNKDDMRRVGYTRSSRTDKGVHAAGFVAGAKLELDPAYSFEKEPFGFTLADQINAHPDMHPDIRVLSVQKAGKGFDAKNMAMNREYIYLLPLRCLGTATVSQEDALATLRETLRKYEGVFNWHNYTSHRSIKNLKEEKERVRDLRVAKRARAGSPSAENRTKEEQPQSESEGEEAELDAEEAPAGNDDDKCPVLTMKESPEELEAKLREMQDYTIIVQSGFRTVFHCYAEEVIDVTVDESWTQKYIPIRLVGASFVFNQIRKMVGHALAIANGYYPPESQMLALEGPMKIKTPLACGFPLHLRKVHYKTNGKADERIIYNAEVEERMENFRRTVLYPHIAKLDRDSKEFDNFAAGMEADLRVQPYFFDVVSRVFADWKVGNERIKQEKLERRNAAGVNFGGLPNQFGFELVRKYDVELASSSKSKAMSSKQTNAKLRKQAMDSVEKELSNPEAASSAAAAPVVEAPAAAAVSESAPAEPLRNAKGKLVISIDRVKSFLASEMDAGTLKRNEGHDYYFEFIDSVGGLLEAEKRGALVQEMQRAKLLQQQRQEQQKSDSASSKGEEQQPQNSE